MQKSLTKADSAGFCFGVSRAVEMVSDLLEQGKKVCTLGPIIHNMEMVEELRQKGCRPVDSVDELAEDEILVIRSHGVPKSVIDGVKLRGVEYRDATCPFVKKIHRIVAETDPDLWARIEKREPNAYLTLLYWDTEWYKRSSRTRRQNEAGDNRDYKELTRKMLFDAAKDAGVQLRQIENRRQSPDHPILWGVPETEYLKFYLFQVV